MLDVNIEIVNILYVIDNFITFISDGKDFIICSVRNFTRSVGILLKKKTEQMMLNITEYLIKNV